MSKPESVFSSLDRLELLGRNPEDKEVHWTGYMAKELGLLAITCS